MATIFNSETVTNYFIAARQKLIKEDGTIDAHNVGGAWSLVTGAIELSPETRCIVDEDINLSAELDHITSKVRQATREELKFQKTEVAEAIKIIDTLLRKISQ